MPKTRVIFFKEKEGYVPVVEWLAELKKRDLRAWANCRARIEMLKTFGFELRRPVADYLKEGIYELRAKQGHVQYRILYFFHGKNVAILAHSLTKEQSVPQVDIERAIHRKEIFLRNHRESTYEENKDSITKKNE